MLHARRHARRSVRLLLLIALAAGGCGDDPAVPVTPVATPPTSAPATPDPDPDPAPPASAPAGDRAPAIDPVPAVASGNAAPEYLRLRDAFGHDLNVAAFEASYADPWRGTFRADLTRAEPLVLELIENTKRPECDFGTDYDTFDIDLSHNAAFRYGHQILLLDARRKAEDKDGAAAGTRLAAAVRMERHVARGTHPAEKMMACTMHQQLGKMVAVLDEKGLLDGTARAILRAELERLDPYAPFRAVDGLAHQRTHLVGAMRADRGMERALIDWEGMTPEQRIAAANEIERLFLEMEAAWDAPEPVEALAAVAATADPSVAIMVSSAHTFRYQVQLTIDMLNEMLARLAEVK